MSTGLFLLVAAIASNSYAQSSSSNGLGDFLSDAYSVVSQVKSIVTETASPSTTQSLASSASSTSSTSSRSSSPSSTALSSSATPTSLPLTSVLPTSTQQNSPSSPTATSSASSQHHGSNKLGIILGVVVGLLVAFIIALVLFCCIRHRRRNRTSRHILTPDDDEFENWRSGHHRESLTAGWRPHGATSNYAHVSSTVPSAAPAPDLSHHQAFRDGPHNVEMFQQPTNPFVPVPPAPRRSAPNSRPGLTDTSEPGQEPFVARHPGATAAAAGIGGVALGAAATAHHDRKGAESHRIVRKPVARDSYEKLDQHPSSATHYPSQDSPYSYSHSHTDSSAAPLMSSNDPEKRAYERGEANLPTHYTSDRPATPMGLLAFGGRGKGDGDDSRAARPPRGRPVLGGDSSVEGSTSQSYDSAQSTASVIPPARKSQSVTPPSRSPKRTRFSNNVEEWDGRVSGSGSGSGSRTDSGERLSGSMPGGWGGSGNGSERSSRAVVSPVSPAVVNHSALGRERRRSLGRRLRLSDLRAEEEEAARLRGGYGYGDGWEDVEVGRAY